MSEEAVRCEWCRHMVPGPPAKPNEVILHAKCRGAWLGHKARRAPTWERLAELVRMAGCEWSDGDPGDQRGGLIDADRLADLLRDEASK